MTACEKKKGIGKKRDAAVNIANCTMHDHLTYICTYVCLSVCMSMCVCVCFAATVCSNKIPLRMRKATFAKSFYAQIRHTHTHSHNTNDYKHRLTELCSALALLCVRYGALLCFASLYKENSLYGQENLCFSFMLLLFFS